MRQLFHPGLVNGEFGDPALYVDFLAERRALLFDLGEVSALPPRKPLRVSQVFVSHAHMDHFAGFDHLLRVVLGRKPGIQLFGGPGFIAQVEHKLRAYTWNVVQRYEVELLIDVREVGTDARMQRARFSSRTGFAREACAPAALHDDVLYDELTFRVRARFVDDGTPCLAYAVEEKARIKVAKDHLAALGVSTGAWLRELKHAVLTGAPAGTPIELRWRDRLGEHQMTRTVGELRDVVLDVVPGQRVGYATDLRFTEPNVRALQALLSGADRLFIESVFLDAERDYAIRKNHLTARQAGEIARRVGAKTVVPFHFSPRYEGRATELIAEVRAAWSGTAAPPRADVVGLTPLNGGREPAHYREPAPSGVEPNACTSQNSNNAKESPMPTNHKVTVIGPWQISLGEPGEFPFDFFSRRYLAQGDSWFGFGSIPPGLTTNVLAEMELSRSAVIVNCARPGKVLQHMTDTTSEKSFTRLLAGKFAMKWDGILLSGGGNDLLDAAGVAPSAPPDKRLLATVEERGADVPSGEGYLSEPGWNTFATHLGRVFNNLVDRRDSGINQRVPLVLHVYSHLMPRDAPAGFGFGPWFAPSLAKFAIPPARWLEVSNVLMDRLAQLLRSLADARLASDPAAALHIVDTFGANLVLADPQSTGPSGDFYNEIHPTRGGYDKLAQVWRQTLDALP